MSSNPIADDPFPISATIGRLLGDSGWRAALVILTCDYFVGQHRVWKYVDLRRESILFKDMLKNGGFSGGERRAITLAAGLFNGGDFKIDLQDILSGMDDTFLAVAILAIQASCLSNVYAMVAPRIAEILQRKLTHPTHLP